MKKSFIILLCILLAAGAFAESTLQISASNSIGNYILEPAGRYWVKNLLWPYNTDVISLTYLHDISEGSRIKAGGDIGGGTWGTFASADIAYSMPAFTAGSLAVSFSAVEKLGIYIPFFSLISITDLELTARRPGKKFFFGAGISTSTSALWGYSIDEEDGKSEPTYKIVIRPDVKFTCGWQF